MSEKISFNRKSSWTIHPYTYECLIIDGANICSSLKEGMRVDGIDPRGFRDARTGSFILETGDDLSSFIR